MSGVTRVLRDPTAQFVCVGLVLVVGHRVLVPDAWRGAEDDRTIVVTASRVERIQQQWLMARGELPSDEQLREEVIELADTEILYREALRLGLDRGDEVVKRRLAQKMRFLLEDTATAAPPPVSEVDAHIEAHRMRFSSSAALRMSHVYFEPGETRGDALRRAETVRRVLDGTGAQPGLATQALGDPFAMQRSAGFRERTQLSRVLGKEFSDAVFDLDSGRWSAPLVSSLGIHLVWVHETRPASLVDVAAARARARSEIVADRRRRSNAAIVKGLRERYHLRVEPPRGAI